MIVGQVIGRQRRIEALELETLRALGAGPVTIAADATLGTVVAVVAGALLASVIAFFLSPLFPLGPVRPVYPYFLGWDWTVLGLGFLALVVLMSTLALGLALRDGPRRRQRRTQQAERPSVVARAVGSSGLPAPAMTGVRFALEPGGRRGRARPLGDPRRRAGHRGHRRHRDLRVQSQLAHRPSPSVRVELGLRPVLGVLG